MLDWGRARRLFTPAQTKRLWLRDGGCTYPGCDAPPQWCDAHHLVHWTDFGPSDLTNAALLCEHHHQLVHRRRLAGSVVDGVASRGAPLGSRVEWDLTVGSYDQLLAHRGARDHRAEPA
ncbi:HNH endonuclease signature motif containing protein [Nostocoides sp. HKS02]|uniref:HNH endonuclease signature motif containing protein n=1 Tax=Nostocoides sp. HKS02 TaxID=1813880 RepID=UPI001E5C6A5E|nr:HNH endonuclease signature motif containing protein [Tetrasphaera sp. HKS02]